MSRPALKSTSDKAYESCRQGNHATIYEVRRDPKLANKNLIKDENSDKFPFISGAVYRGEWEKDQKSGFGTQTNSDGSKYEGEFKRNLYHGSGSLWIKKGKRSVKQYTGNWENGKMSGFGSLFMDNGDIYKGDWVANKRSGEGRLDSPNGDYFIGQWIDNVQKGYGTMYLKNGNVFEGLYLDGIKDGPGRFFYAATKKVYEGEWVNGSPSCGEYREPTKEEEIRFREPSIARQCFELPELGLLDSQSIMDIAKTETRIVNAARRGLDIAPAAGAGSLKDILSKECISRAAAAFAELDTSGGGLLPLSALKPVFHELGSDFSDGNIEAIRLELEIEMDTLLSLPETVDIATYLLSNTQQETDLDH